MSLRSTWPAATVQQTEISGVPFFPQDDYQCGPAALATTLVYAGLPVTPEALISEVYIPARKGSLQTDMLAAARRHGIVSYQLAPRFDDLLREVAAGNPVIVLQDNGVGFISNWHYAVIVGFDYPAGELYLRSGTHQRLALPFTIFEYTWKKSGYWAMVTPTPGRVPPTATEPAYVAAVAAMERVGDPRTAQQAWQATHQRWPENVTASLGLANQHYALGELDAAERVLRDAAAHHPDSVPVLNNLAQTLSDQGKHNEALAVIERAVRTGDGPFSAAVLQTRAEIHKRAAGTP